MALLQKFEKETPHQVGITLAQYESQKVQFLDFDAVALADLFPWHHTPNVTKLLYFFVERKKRCQHNIKESKPFSIFYQLFCCGGRVIVFPFLIVVLRLFPQYYVQRHYSCSWRKKLFRCFVFEKQTIFLEQTQQFAHRTFEFWSVYLEHPSSRFIHPSDLNFFLELFLVNNVLL